MLHVIQAQFGDCFIVEYGAPAKYILIDGGPTGVYENSLRPELKRIVRSKVLEAVIITHVDIDHIKGVLELLSELKSDVDSGREPFLRVNGLWMNTFSDTIDTNGDITRGLQEIQAQTMNNGIQMVETNLAFNGIKEGDKITTLCRILDIPMNEPVQGGIFKTGQPEAPIEMDNLQLTIVGPTQKNLNNLKAEWEEWIEKREAELTSLEILSMSDKSIPNLSSLMFYLQDGNKTFLFTGDGRGDHLLEGLADTGLLVEEAFHVDVFKVPHHASKRNTDRRFFDQVTASIYVISANGKYDNPDYETLTWIVESGQEQGRRTKLVITNETDNSRKLASTHEEETFGYSMRFIPDNKFSVIV